MHRLKQKLMFSTDLNYVYFQSVDLKITWNLLKILLGFSTDIVVPFKISKEKYILEIFVLYRHSPICHVQTCVIIAQSSKLTVFEESQTN